MTKNSFICVCGHTKFIHDPAKWTDTSTHYSTATYMEDACYSKIINKDGMDDLCPCREFKVDNLRYLEQLSEQSKK